MSLLSADSSPNGLVTGVRKANKKPLWIVATILFIVVLVIAIVAAERAQRSAGMTADKPEQEKPAVDATTSTLNDFERLYGGTGEIAAAGEESTPPAEEQDALTAPADVAVEEKGDGQLHAGEKKELHGRPIQYQQTLEAFSSKKQGLFEAALTARMGVALPEPTAMPVRMSSSSSTGSQLEDLRKRTAAGGQRATYEDRLAEVQRIQGEADAASGMDDEAYDAGDSSEIHATTDETWTLGSRLQRPATPFVVRTGFVIPGVMVGGINSDLPGQIKGQVSQTVYDTATGRFPLIPQGSMLVGVYSSDVAFGQERVQVAWQRIIFPDGRAINISGMPGADAGGYSGLHDIVDHHWGRIFGAALAMSVISAGYSLSQDNNSGDDEQSASGALSESLGQTLGQTGMQITQKNLSIQPTNIIRPGNRFNVMVSKDIVFDAPYQAFSY
jgi:type IV secretory pathway VirB10-like protein